MSDLPNIKITLGNGGLKQTVQTRDGVCGLICTGSSVTGTGMVSVGTSYELKSLKGAENIGIDETNNEFAWKRVQDFYKEAKTGATLWIMLVPNTVTLPDMVDITISTYSDKLLKDAKGAIRILSIAHKLTTFGTPVNGLEPSVSIAVIKAQELVEAWFTRFRPLHVIVDGCGMTSTLSNLKDWKTDNKNRVSILISNNDNSNYSSVGLLLGRLAKIPVQRNPGRVKDGQVEDAQAYFTNQETAEFHEENWNDLHDKGYIFLRSYVNKAGYYFSHGLTLTSETDDYKSIPRGRVIHKIAMLAYEVYVTEILDEIPVTASGTIHPAVVKSWEARLETTITQQMIANGELSGIKVTIDPNQIVLSNGTVNIDVRALPVGYAEYINIQLGFDDSLIN